MEVHVQICSKMGVLLFLCCYVYTKTDVYNIVYYLDRRNMTDISYSQVNARSRLECLKSCFHNGGCLSVLYGDVNSTLTDCHHVANVLEVKQENIFSSLSSENLTFKDIWFFIPLNNSNWALLTQALVSTTSTPTSSSSPLTSTTTSTTSTQATSTSPSTSTISSSPITSTTLSSSSPLASTPTSSATSTATSTTSTSPSTSETTSSTTSTSSSTTSWSTTTSTSINWLNIGCKRSVCCYFRI